MPAPSPALARGHDGRLRAIAWLALLAATLLFSLGAHLSSRFPFDLRLARRVQDLPLQRLDGAIDALNSNVGPVAIVFALALAALLAWRRLWPEAALLVCSVLIRLATTAIKALVDRPRPSPDLVRVTEHAGESSFPSGHSLGTFAICAALFFLAGALVEDRRLRAAARLACVLVTLAVGFARVWVGAHWPSDVAGGWLWAATLLLPALAGYRALRRETGRNSREPHPAEQA